MTDNNAGALIIGSRGSQLARWQADHISGRLNGAPIKIIKTTGDRKLNMALQGQDTKGFFTKEIEDALLDGSIDLAVHSLKDLPTELPEGLTLGAVTTRAGFSDLLVIRPDKVDENHAFPLSSGATIGATSLRRQSLLRRFAPHLEPTLLRGNVPTRIDKLRKGEYDAIIIARAGIERLKLDLSDLSVYELNPRVWLPAAGQAVLGIEIRDGDEKTASAMNILHDEDAWRAVRIERQLLARFEGGCHVAFGCLATPKATGVEILIGFENNEGRWFAACVENEDDDAACDAAYEKLQRVIQNGKEEDEWSAPLIQPFQQSF